MCLNKGIKQDDQHRYSTLTRQLAELYHHCTAIDIDIIQLYKTVFLIKIAY